MKDLSKTILTYKIKHDRDFTAELEKARKIAEFSIINRKITSKHVKHIGLKSQISSQIIWKYSRDFNCKKVKNVKLTIHGTHIFYRDNTIKIPCLKLDFPFEKEIDDIKRIEIDNLYYYVSCSVNRVKLNEKVCGYIGVDRNATSHIAVCAMDNKIFKFGKIANHVTRKYDSIRKKAQRERNYKFLKRLRNKKARITKDLNHKISKKIVELAYEKGYGIKLENLKGIKENKQKDSFNKTTNSQLSNWSYFMLQQFIEYKANLYGVAVFYVDPAYTSQKCSRCGLIGKREKKTFACDNCRHRDHADANASFNIANSNILFDSNKAKASACESKIESYIDRDIYEGISDNAQEEMVCKEFQPQIACENREVAEIFGNRECIF